MTAAAEIVLFDDAELAIFVVFQLNTNDPPRPAYAVLIST